MMFWLKGHFKDRKSDPQIALILSLLYCPNDDHWIQIWLYIEWVRTPFMASCTQYNIMW
jgi:hypothetical protein